MMKEASKLVIFEGSRVPVWFKRMLYIVTESDVTKNYNLDAAIVRTSHLETMIYR